MEFECAKPRELRRIIHVDMDAFFASVEQRDNPELRNKPVVVGGSKEGRGVVAAASYEARRYGIHSAMPSRTAARLCPDAVFVRPRFERYKEISHQVISIFKSYTEVVEPLSLDEGFLDVTDNKRGIPLACEIAKQIRQEIFTETGLTASAGVAPNKFLAKIASEYRKPNGLTVIAPERVENFLLTLPVRKFPGVGPHTESKLQAHGFFTAADLRKVSDADLRNKFGKFGGWLYKVCRGLDDREVNGSRDRKSLGAEDTFEQDLVGLPRLNEELERIARIVERRLETKGLAGPTLTLKITFAGFEKISRSMTLARPLMTVGEIASLGQSLLERTDAAKGRAVRLLGLQVSGFLKGETKQICLPLRPRGELSKVLH